MDKVLLILGAGGHGKVVADCALSSGQWDRVLFLDDRYPDLEQAGHWPVIGRVSDLEHFVNDYPFMALGVGVNHDLLRVQWLEYGINAGASFPAIIHSRAVVSPFAAIGAGTVICAGAVVCVDAAVGQACILNTHCSIDHDCTIGDGSHISPSATLGGGVVVGECAWVGLGASVIQGVAIGSNAVVGSGAVVIRDVPAKMKMAGVPARLMLRHCL